MSDTKSPSLSQYFASDGNKSETPVCFTNEMKETEKKFDNLRLESEINNEPEVCRIFAQNQLQAKDATFFDLIGNPSKNVTSGALSDFGLSTDDGYCSRVAVGTEVDRRRDAWIPSEKTRLCLISAVTVPPGSFFPERDLLTMPGVLWEEELGDNIGEAVSACLGDAEAAQRRILTASDVTQDERGLRELVQAGAYRPAINLTARLLTIYGQGRGRSGHPSKHSPHSLQLWFTRIALLVKIKAFQLAQAEAEPFGQLDKPDLFYQFYPEMYGTRPGSIASFSFRLLLAELPMHCGKSKESLTKLFSLLSVVKQMLQNLRNGLCEDGSPTEIQDSDRTDSIRLWNGREIRIVHSIINCALTLKDYELAMNLLGQLCDREGAPRHALLSALGRLHLQVGNISGAEVCFSEAREIKSGPPDVREFVDRGLLAVAQNAFNDAYVCFQQANLLEPSNVMVLNNMGVCLLYGGHLKEAIAVLESAINLNPIQGLHESLLLNLCTLYDMESSKGRKKKFALLKQLSKYEADAPTTILEKLYG